MHLPDPVFYLLFAGTPLASAVLLPSGPSEPVPFRLPVSNKPLVEQDQVI